MYLVTSLSTHFLFFLMQRCACVVDVNWLNATHLNSNIFWLIFLTDPVTIILSFIDIPIKILGIGIDILMENNTDRIGLLQSSACTNTENKCRKSEYAVSGVNSFIVAV